MANKYHEYVDFPTPKADCNSEPPETDIYINPVKATLCTHLSTIRVTGVCVGGILIALIVFAALKSKVTSQQGSIFMFELQSRESC